MTRGRAKGVPTRRLEDAHRGERARDRKRRYGYAQGIGYLKLDARSWCYRCSGGHAWAEACPAVSS